MVKSCCSSADILRLPQHYRLVGLVVKAYASRAEDPGFESCLRREREGGGERERGGEREGGEREGGRGGGRERGGGGRGRKKEGRKERPNKQKGYQTSLQTNESTNSRANKNYRSNCQPTIAMQSEEKQLKQSKAKGTKRYQTKTNDEQINT